MKLPTLSLDDKCIDPKRVKKATLIKSKNGTWYIYCLVDSTPCFLVATDDLLSWLKASSIRVLEVTDDWKEDILRSEKIDEGNLTLFQCLNVPLEFKNTHIASKLT